MPNGATKKALNILDEAIVDDIPMKNGKIDLPEYRKKTFKVQRAIALVQKNQIQQFDDHCEWGEKENAKTQKRIKRNAVSNVFFSIAIVGLIVGIHWGWEWAGGSSVVLSIIGLVTKAIPLLK